MLNNKNGMMLQGHVLPERSLMTNNSLVTNEVVSRRAMLKSLLDPRRDVNYECGYAETESITVDDYVQMYDREAIAARVVELEPIESWQLKPEIYESEDEDIVTPFEASWRHLCDNFEQNSWFKPEDDTHPIWEYLRRGDVLSGIGHFGVLLLGIDDGKELKEPITGFESTGPTYNLAPKKVLAQEPEDDDEEYESEEVEESGEADLVIDGMLEDVMPEALEAEPVDMKHKLLFVRAFDESLIQINSYESDPTSPRYGQPLIYTLTLNDPKDNHQSGIGLSTQTVEVHWSRVIHLADNRGSSEIFGTPRQRPVWNRLMDCRKIYSSSGEGYWQGAFPGISLETHPQLGGDVTIDTERTKKQMYDYTNSLQRYIMTSGMSAKTMSAQVVDPNPQIQANIDAICIKLGCPKRIFMGSERGELASSEDKDTWGERINERRTGYLTHKIIVPFVNRLIHIEVLPEPAESFCVSWDKPDEQTAEDKATIAKTVTEALSAYVSGGVDTLLAPREYLIQIHGFKADEVDSWLEAAVEHVNEANPDLDDVTVPGITPKQPPPDNPFIKMKEGETLVNPDGSPIGNKGANLETMGEFEDASLLLEELLAMPAPSDALTFNELNGYIDELEDLINNKFVSAAQRRWWFATKGGKSGKKGKKSRGPQSEGHLSSSAGLIDHIKNNSKDMKFTASKLEKIKFLNPEGIKNNTFLLDHSAKNTDRYVEHFKKILPEGTSIKVVKSLHKKDLESTSGKVMPVKDLLPKPVTPSPVTKTTSSGAPKHITHTGKETEFSKDIWKDLQNIEVKHYSIARSSRHLSAIKAVGKKIDNEVERRVQKFIHSGTHTPGKLAEEVRAVRAKAIQEVVSEVRDMGHNKGKLLPRIESNLDNKSNINYLANACDLYPSDWVKKAKDSGKTIVTSIEDRGKYIPNLATNKVGAVLSAKDDQGKKATAIHEIMHLHEDMNKNLMTLEAAYIDSRLKLGEKAVTRGGEQYFEDEFAHQYTGRTYTTIDRPDPTYFHEVLSTAYENLLLGDKHGRYMDDDLAHFAYGVLVSH